LEEVPVIEVRALHVVLEGHGVLATLVEEERIHEQELFHVDLVALDERHQVDVVIQLVAAPHHHVGRGAGGQVGRDLHLHAVRGPELHADGGLLLLPQG
jgi:hypothetical protein